MDQPKKPATPAQQQQFDLILGRCRQMLGQEAEQWLQTMKADPVQGAVTLGTHTLRTIVQMSEKAGQKVDPVVLINVGLQFIKDIAALANAAGLVPMDQMKNYLREVLQRSMAEYAKADQKERPGMLASMQGGADGDGQDAENPDEDEAEEPAGEGPGPDNTPEHEQAETPATEQAEGSEEDDMAAELERLRAAKRGGA